MAYKPQPVLRVYIPKPGSTKRRPLGIPTLEEKLVQAGLVKILQAIYEQNFINDYSYGFRPKRSCHDALRALSQAVEANPVHHIVEADIKGFFDHVEQEQLISFLQHRIADKRILRYIKRFLKAGIQEDGQHKASERGTPQGGVISPLLANIYLHYTLDIWFEKRVKRNSQGYARLIRYADDYVACFEYAEDARQYMQDMESRLNNNILKLLRKRPSCLNLENLPNQKQKPEANEPRRLIF